MTRRKSIEICNVLDCTCFRTYNRLIARIFKRFFDIIISLLVLFSVFPFICLIVAFGNCISGDCGPLFFTQLRTGYKGNSFRIIKFRSMKENAEADNLQATENDPRITKFGVFLRRSFLDELPQFINVLLGDMSVVGPRPHMIYHTQLYSSLISDYMVRHRVMPGITGWAQVNGFLGETRSVEDMRNRVKYDMWYQEHWTLLLDIRIILKTTGFFLGRRFYK